MKKFITSLMLIFSGIVISAQPLWKNITDTHYTKKAIIDGQKIWIASQGGLICIDQFTSDTSFYNHANSDIPFTDISDLCIDQQGRLWLASEWTGIACKDGDNWTAYNTNNTPLPNNRVFSITCDSQGTIWAGFLRNLVKFDGTNWTSYDLDFTGISSYGPDCIAIDNSDRVLFSIFGLWVFDGDIFTHYDTTNSPLQDNRISCLKSFPDGKTWIGHPYNGLTITDFTNWEVYDTLVSGKQLYQVTAFDRTPDGNYWLGTYQGDLYFKDNNEWSLIYAEAPADTIRYISHLEADYNNNLYINCSNFIKFNGESWFNVNTSESVFHGNTIQDIFHASDHTTWIANYSGMTSFLNNQISNQNSDDSTSYLSTFCYAQDRNGKMYVAHQYGISVFENNTWHRLTIPGNSLFSFHSGNNMCFDLNNNLWIANYPGVVMFDGTNATYYSPNYNNFPNAVIYCIDIDHDGNVVAGFNGGIAIWDGSTWTTKMLVNPPNTDVIIYDIAVKGSDIWLASRAGLIKYNGTDWEYFTPENCPLTEEFVPTLDFDSNGVLWMINGNGNLVRYDGQNWDILTYFETGMLYGAQRTLRIDHLNNIWLGGISCAISIYNENGIFLNVPKPPQTITKEQILQLVYPNPTSGEIKIRYKLPNNQPVYSIIITDLQGKSIDSFQLNTREGTCQYNAEKLSSGQYFISVSNGRSILSSTKVQVVR